MTMQPVLAFAWNPAVGVPLLIVAIIILALIWLFGQPKKEQGKRRVVPSASSGERREPRLGDDDIDDDTPSFSARDASYDDAFDMPLKPKQGELDVGMRAELERLGATLSGERSSSKPMPSKLVGHAASIVDALRAPSVPNEGSALPQPEISVAPVPAAAPAPAPAAPAPKIPPRSDLGRRPAQLAVERIVTLFVVAREGEHFNGPNLVVAAEKAGLEFGDMGIYHRLLEGKRELGPIFSVANMLKPGNFDLVRLDALRTPGVSFFMTLPGPLCALDAWDAMLPTAQRLAELLDGHVLDEERNALGRQRIAHIRDQLRGWDRDHEGKEIIFGR
ncbi:cell division protein ZipA [Rhodanobacter sp. ANJX3]|uniref:cell division protein ZipA n=1 Tax=Rhodanobacter sp. ANJX3 TaxID=2723083 RepID=UPI00160C2A02|nr:cell division protein ZipA [Rhodanobacter sp. ANJX3]MBB5356889.1 cell division protein ZipA [Rhodanobacter sp. ANJX3]